MAIVVKNTNYNGEVLEQLLTLAATGNEIVEKGLIMVIPGVEKKISLPRLKSGKMLQKRKENPGVEDSKGNFNYDEKALIRRTSWPLPCLIHVHLKTSGESGSPKVTLYLQSCHLKPKMLFWQN